MQALTQLLPFVVFIAALWRPAWALTAIVVMFPLETLLTASGSAFAGTQWLFNVVTGAVVVLALVRRWLSGLGLTQDLWSRALVAGWLFYAWGYLSTAWTPTDGTFLFQTTAALPYWILMIVLAPMLIGRLEEVGDLAFSILLVGTAVAALIILNPAFTLSSARLGSESGADRGNPLALGTLGGTMMIVAALAPSAGVALWRLGLNSVAFFAGGGLAVLSGSRGQVIFAVLAIAVLLPVRYRLTSAKGLLLSGLAAVMVIVGLAVVFARFVDRRNDDRWDAHSLTTGGSGRFENASELLVAYLSDPMHWIQGLGLSAFDSLETSSGDQYSHVLFADAIAEGGLVGASLLAIMLLATFRNSRRIIGETSEEPTPRGLACILVGLILYHLLLANKQGGMLGNPMLFAYSFMLSRVSLEWSRRYWSDEWLESGSALVANETSEVPGSTVSGAAR